MIALELAMGKREGEKIGAFFLSFVSYLEKVHCFISVSALFLSHKSSVPSDFITRGLS